MDRVEIYNNGKIKVEIDGVFHKILQEFIVKTIQLTPVQYKNILEVVFESIILSDIDYKGCTVKASSSVPILEKYKMLSLIEPFDIFEYAFDILVSMDKDECLNNIQEIEEIIYCYYNLNNIPFQIKIFPNSIYQIDGFIAVKIEQELLISLFAFDSSKNDFIEESD